MADAMIASSIDVTNFAATEIVRLISSGEITAVEVVSQFLARLDRYAELNACISVYAADAIGAARAIDARHRAGQGAGRLAGLPVLVKDNIEVAGRPCSAGTPALFGNIASHSAAIVDALTSEGAIVIGRLNMHELALGVTTTNPALGIARNPYDLSRTPGGSSGGASAALAARLAPVALGSDTGASVRAPAAFCGVSALRPTVGDGLHDRRYPLDGVVPLSPTRDTVGPMARTLGDVAFIDAIITGNHKLAPVELAKIRLGVPKRLFWDNLDNELSDMCHLALRRLQAAGVTLIDVDLASALDFDGAASIAITLYELEPNMRRYLAGRTSAVTYEDIVAQAASPDVQSLLALAASVSADEYGQAIGVTLPALRAAYRAFFADHDIDGVIFPTSPIPAPKIDETVSGRVEINGVEQAGGTAALFSAVIRNLDADSLAGIPSIAFPAGMTALGLPVGLEIDGPVGSDRHLLAIGIEIEQCLGPVPPPAGFDILTDLPEL